MATKPAKMSAKAREEKTAKEEAMKAAKKSAKKQRSSQRFFYNCRCIECGKPRTIPGKLCKRCREEARKGSLEVSQEIY